MHTEDVLPPPSRPVYGVSRRNMAPQGMRTDKGLVPWAAYRSQSISLGHFHPDPQCGICGGVFQFNDRCVGCKSCVVPHRNCSTYLLPADLLLYNSSTRKPQLNHALALHHALSLPGLRLH